MCHARGSGNSKGGPWVAITWIVGMPPFAIPEASWVELGLLGQVTQAGAFVIMTVLYTRVFTSVRADQLTRAVQ